MVVVPIRPGAPDDLDAFSDLYQDVKSLNDHELQLTIGSIRPPKVPWRSIHPVVRQFPQLSDTEYDKLRTDILAKGQRKAICMYQGMIWDGRARYDICIDLGLLPKIRTLRRGDPIVYLMHRHDRFGLPSTPERHAAVDLLRKVYTDEWKKQAQEQRAEWIEQARADFQRRWLSPQKCAVCELSAEYSHAHHSLPLNVQFDYGVHEPIQEYDWLCPVHHNLVHRRISAELLGTRDYGGDDYSYRYGKDAFKRQFAARSLENVIAKASRLFAEIGGVSPRGNWSMFSP